VKELLKSVSISQSCAQKKKGPVFLTHSVVFNRTQLYCDRCNRKCWCILEL